MFLSLVVMTESLFYRHWLSCGDVRRPPRLFIFSQLVLGELLEEAGVLQMVRGQVGSVFHHKVEVFERFLMLA